MLCWVISVSVVWAQMDDQVVAKKKYEAYKAKVMAGDITIDWRDFRLTAALGEVSQGFDSQPVHNQVVDDLAAGRYEKALAEAQTVIDRNMANFEGHLLAMTVLQKMGRNEEAKKHEAILNAIGDSIMESGDGNSAATAWFTVAPSETILFMTEALGAEIEDHDFVHVNGHAYDKLTVRDRQGERRASRADRSHDQEIVLACGEKPAYGYRRVVWWLGRHHGLLINGKRALRVMRERGLLVRQRRFQVSRRKDWGKVEAPYPNHVWQSDMTKVWAGPSVGWAYLVSVIDCCTREIVGWDLSLRCRTDEALAALNRAVLEVLPFGSRGMGLTLTTDNGTQFTSARYVETLNQLGVVWFNTDTNELLKDRALHPKVDPQ